MRRSQPRHCTRVIDGFFFGDGDDLPGSYVSGKEIWPFVHHPHADHRSPGMSEYDDLRLAKVLA